MALLGQIGLVEISTLSSLLGQIVEISTLSSLLGQIVEISALSL
jgi:chemotaxis protein CheY-P-specific phosphatase CheC